MEKSDRVKAINKLESWLYEYFDYKLMYRRAIMTPEEKESIDDSFQLFGGIIYAPILVIKHFGPPPPGITNPDDTWLWQEVTKNINGIAGQYLSGEITFNKYLKLEREIYKT